MLRSNPISRLLAIVGALAAASYVPCIEARQLGAASLNSISLGGNGIGGGRHGAHMTQVRKARKARNVRRHKAHAH